MGYKDIREYIKVLEAKGKLYRVTTPVDKSWEISCMAKWVYQGFSEDERFALLFEDVKDSSIPVHRSLTGGLCLGTRDHTGRDTRHLAAGAEQSNCTEGGSLGPCSRCYDP